MNTGQGGFLDRVREGLEGLPAAERRLGDFVCDFPGELASYSASELARLANVSNATVTRFVRRLGYQSYDEARRHAREEKMTGSVLYLSKARSDGASQPAAVHLSQSIANLEQTFLAIPEAQIDAAVEAMRDARRIWVMGFRSGQPLAAYLHWQMLQATDKIQLVPGPGQTLGEYMAGIFPEDVVVVFALRRRIAQMDDILAAIHKRGARLIYITDESAALNLSAAWHFSCQTLAPGPLFNHVSVMALCHLLTTRLIETSGPEGRKRLRAIETSRDAMREL